MSNITILSIEKTSEILQTMARSFHMEQLKEASGHSSLRKMEMVKRGLEVAALNYAAAVNAEAADVSALKMLEEFDLEDPK